MRTVEEFRAFLDGLGKNETALAVAFAELLRRGDGEGRSDRGEWIAGVTETLGRLTGSRGDGAGVSGSSVLPEGVASLLEEEVIPRLELATLAFRDPTDEGWECMCIAPGLWQVLAMDRATLLSDLDARVRVLHEGHVSDLRSPEIVSEANGDSVLRADSLTKIYQKRKVVNEVHVSVRQGEIVGLLGPNGAGKTTTFYMMVGLIPPHSGTVHLDGDDITNTAMYRRARRGIGYLAQEPSVFRRLTVEENVLAILETLKLPKSARRERLDQLLGELGLEQLRKRKAYSLSGGERRRLEITRALVQQPKFMLLDEPFAGIDPIAVNDIQQIVRGLKDRDIGVIISDHNVEQTLEIVDRAYIMYEGRIRVSGTVSELVWNEEVAEIYLGPTLTARMRARYPEPAVV